MKKNRIILFLLVTLFSINIGMTQNIQECDCCTENYNQFDFWLGEWNVYNENDKLVGTNIITKDYDNCVL